MTNYEKYKMSVEEMAELLNHATSGFHYSTQPLFKWAVVRTIKYIKYIKYIRNFNSPQTPYLCGFQKSYAVVYPPFCCLLPPFLLFFTPPFCCLLPPSTCIEIKRQICVKHDRGDM